MGVSLNGGKHPPFHTPKMMIFSRKTRGFVGETHHLRKDPYTLTIHVGTVNLYKIHKRVGAWVPLGHHSHPSNFLIMGLDALGTHGVHPKSRQVSQGVNSLIYRHQGCLKRHAFSPPPGMRIFRVYL